MSKIGYARVSTEEQNLELQLDALRAAGCEIIYEEKASGKSRAGRPELEHCLKALRSSDVLVVWRLDRLGRNLADLVQVVADLEARGIGFHSLTESVDCTGAAGKLTLHLFAVLAEFERNLIRERTKAGLASARARGRVGGRPKALTPSQEREVRLLMADPHVRPADVMKRYGISRATLYKYAPAGVVAGELQPGQTADLVSAVAPKKKARAVGKATAEPRTGDGASAGSPRPMLAALLAEMPDGLPLADGWDNMPSVGLETD